MKFDSKGRLDKASWVPSPNFYPGANPREVIVMH